MLVWLLACGGSPIYAPCDVAADCPAPEGVTSECLDADAEAGFCTWSCDEDQDCAFDEDDYERVCAPLDSEPGKHCFPSCEEADDDDPEACPPNFECRSTGGGNENRKICFPSGL